MRDASFTSSDVAQAVAAAINGVRSANFNVTALAVGSRIILDGDRSVSAALPGLVTTMQSRFDAGPVLLVTNDFSGFVDGQSLRIRDDQQTTLNFEFDTNNRLNDPNAVRIVIAAGDSKAADRLASRRRDQCGAVSRDRHRAGRPRLPDERPRCRPRRQITALQRDVAGSDHFLGDRRAAVLCWTFLAATDDPGHRQIPEEVGRSVEQHVNQDFADKARDATPGITTIIVQLPQTISGAGFSNVITEQQQNGLGRRSSSGATTWACSSWSRPAKV